MLAHDAGSFGVLLRRYRLAAGLTQATLAEQAGVSERAITDLERDHRRHPRLDTAALLVKALALPDADRALLLAAARLNVSTQIPAPEAQESAPLVGRTAELALLEGHLSREGPPLLLLAGEPGIGKTRLLHELMLRARGLGWRVLQSGCQRLGEEEPYAPLPDALVRALRHMIPAQRLEALHGCTWLARLLPELAEERDLAGTLALPPPGTRHPAQERRLIFQSVGRFLANVAGPAGTLLLLDDLQWSGADTLALVASLVRTEEGSSDASSLRIVGAYRDTDVPADHALVGIQADLAQAGLVTHRTVAPLARADTRALLGALLPLAPEQLEAGWVEQLAERTGGVPFFIVSYAQNLTDARQAEAFAQDGPAAAEAVPWTVRRSVQQRLALLADAARRLLGAAAVVGREVSVDLIARVTDQPEDVVVDALDAAAQLRLLEDDLAGGYRFSHDLIREVVEKELTSPRRALVHRRVAEVLELQSEEPPVEALAYHYARGGSAEKAVLYLERAGDRALARRAHAAAEGYYRDLVEQLDRLGQVLVAARGREKWGRVLQILPRYEMALEILEQAVAAYEAAGDQESVVRVVAAIGQVYQNMDRPRAGLARLEPVLARLDEATPSHGLAALYAVLANLCIGPVRYHRQLAAAKRAEELARLVGDPHLEAFATYCRGFALLLLGRTGEARAMFERTIAQSEALGDLERLGWATCLLTSLRIWTGDFKAAQETGARALAVAQRRGDPAQIAFFTQEIGVLALFLGDWEAARHGFEQAATLFRGVEGFWGIPDARVQAGWLALEEGRWEEAAQLLDPIVDRAECDGSPMVLIRAQILRAELDILQEHPEMARARLAGWVDPPGVETLDGSLLLPTLAWALLELGEASAARELVTQAIRQGHRQQHCVALVNALRVQALVSLHDGDSAEAVRALDEGLALARRMGYPYAEGRLLHVYGSLHARMGQPTQAQESLESALAVFERLGARQDVERARQALMADHAGTL
jgi:tetratricopeptide (TPR) repeat protein/transcriptional regulator with XRE-family HTH domain